MKKRSQRIAVVVDLAQRDEDKLADAFTQAKLAVQTAHAQLTDLNQYYQGYIDRFKQQTQGLRASDLINSRAFLQQLSVAIDSQRRQVDLLEKQLQHAQIQWHRSHLKTQSLMDLRTQYRKDEAEQADRHEQKALDEWVSQRRMSDEG